MNKIVLEHYPASKLPEEMRGNVDPNATVTVVVTVEDVQRERRPTLDEIFACRCPPFLTAEDIDENLRRDRDEWDD